MVEPKLLFSEGQVSELVDAKTTEWIATQKLADSLPNTIIINRSKTLAKLREMESEIVNKHGQAVRAWRKAYKLYANHIQRNPGSKALNPPGEQPTLGNRIENVRAIIRAYDSIDDSKVRISRAEWIQVFRDASQAIAEMRSTRDQYVMFVSGATATNLSLSTYK